MNKKLITLLSSFFVVCLVACSPSPDEPPIDPPEKHTPTITILLNGEETNLTNLGEFTLPDIPSLSYRLDFVVDSDYAFFKGTQNLGHDLTSEPGEYTYTVTTVDDGLLNSAIKSVIFSLVEDISSEDIDYGVKSIQEAKALCLSEVKNPSNLPVVVDFNKKVTIKGYLYDKIDLKKSKKDYGLNISGPGKSMFIDGSGYIACASLTGQNTLWDKTDSYANKANSYYQITGYLSLYLGHPEIFVNDKEMITYNSSLNIPYDYESLAETITVDEFYTIAQNNNYNCAGHGYDNLYRLDNMYCYEKEDDKARFTDGVHFVKTIDVGNVTYSKGVTYSLIGDLSLESYSPAIKLVKAIRSDTQKVKDELSPEIVDVTMTNFKKNDASQDDTNKRYPEFILLNKCLYRANVYINSYIVNGKYYVCCSDNYVTNQDIVNRSTASVTYGMVNIRNKNFWNASESEVVNYNPFYQDYYYENAVVEIVFSPDIHEYASSKVVWSVFVMDL